MITVPSTARVNFLGVKRSTSATIKPSAMAPSTKPLAMGILTKPITRKQTATSRPAISESTCIMRNGPGCQLAPRSFMALIVPLLQLKSTDFCPAPTSSLIGHGLSSFIQRATAIGWRHMGFEEVGYPLVGVDLVFYFREAVPFVFVDFVFGDSTPFFHGVDYLLRFFFGAARIVASGEQIERRFDFVHEVDGGTIFVERFVLHQIAHGGQIALLQHGVFVRDLGEPVHEGDDRNARGPDFWSFRDSHHRHVATVAAAHQNEFLGIDVAGLFDPVGG